MIEATLTILGLLVTIIVSFGTAKIAARRDRDRLREELKLEYSIENAIRKLLSNKEYQKRSFGKIKHHLRGFRCDDELRVALIRAGAVAFSGDGEDEMWGLISRNSEDFK
jgi:hypothetical protein